MYVSIFFTWYFATFPLLPSGWIWRVTMKIITRLKILKEWILGREMRLPLSPLDLLAHYRNSETREILTYFIGTPKGYKIYTSRPIRYRKIHLFDWSITSTAAVYGLVKSNVFRGLFVFQRSVRENVETKNERKTLLSPPSKIISPFR